MNLQSIAEDLGFKGKNIKNKANKILLKLKKDKFLYYKERKGIKGSFLIHLPFCYTPNKEGFTSIEHFFKAEAEQKLHAQKQKLNNKNKLTESNFSSDLVSEQGRGYNTNTHKDTDTDKNRNRGHFALQEDYMKTSLFKPADKSEEFCKVIAEDIGDEYMYYILSVLDKHGIDHIENAYEIFEENRAIEFVDNPPAYFNSIIESLIEQS